MGISEIALDIIKMPFDVKNILTYFDTRVYKY